MTYPFDPELRPIIDQLPRFDLEDVVRDRLVMDAMISEGVENLDGGGVLISNREMRVPGSDVAIPLRIYQPVGQAGPVPGLMHYHGGGFVFGSLDSEQALCVQLCRGLGIVVVSVGYRLAPENPYPAPLDDCYNALVWSHEQAGALGIDVDRLGVLGQSAGANLAAACALRARDSDGPGICYQYLGIPVTDDRLDTPSMHRFTDTPLWRRASAERSWDYYLGESFGRGDALVPALAAPARAQALSGLPPACITVMEFDPLRDEGLYYAQRLLAAGVSTEIHCYPGTFHGSSVVGTAAISQREAVNMFAALQRGHKI